MAKEKTTDELLLKYKTKYTSLMFGSFSIISMFIAIIFYENIFTLGDTIVTYSGNRLNESFIISIVFMIISILFSIIGIIYSIKNKKTLGLLLSVIVLIGLGFTYSKVESFSASEVISKIEIVK